MTTIIIATDLSERSDRALARALALAQELNSKLHILHVVDEDLPSRIAADASKAARENIQARLSSMDSGTNAEVHVEEGQAWATIARRAHELDCDLVVLGTHRHRGIAELFVGTTIQRLAKACDVPILLVCDPMTGPYRNVIVGIDFSPIAQRTAKLAAFVAPDAEIAVVHAYHIPFKALTMRTDAAGDIPKKERDAIERPLLTELTDFTAGIGGSEHRIRKVVREGGATSVLSQEVRMSSADLLAIGAHTRSALATGLLGSTAADVLTTPPCDVLLVPGNRVGAEGEVP